MGAHRIPINPLRIGAQDSGNELSIYRELIAGYQIGIWQGARLI
jgi:hypothetical protein